MNVQRFVSFRAILNRLGVKPHARDSVRCKCLEKYITELGAKSFVLEDEYTDPGYLLDYSNYYARSHGTIDKRTKRIHFFKTDSAKLRTLWNSSLGSAESGRAADKKASAVYLGFVVLKPLPLTIIGRTCLRTYPERDSKDKRIRHFPILRAYDVTLYGMRLEIRSVAFQEQDTEVAACATTAIWYALHGLTKKYTTHEIPSPYEITNQGSDNMPTPTPGKVARKFPSSGLSVPQIDTYFRRCGLDSIVITLDPLEKPSTFLDNISAFIRGRAPIILLGALYANDEHQPAAFDDLGYHAMTILGFSVEDGFVAGPYAERIARLFAHDDNVGPFSSFHIERVSISEHYKLTGENLNGGSPPDEAGNGEQSLQVAGPEKMTTHLLNVSGLQTRGGEVYRKLVPKYLVIPIDPKVRYPYEIVRDFAEVLYEIAYSDPVFSGTRISWSIELRDISDFKLDVRSAAWINRDTKEKALHESMARHLWILRYSVKGTRKADKPIVEFIFDATGLHQSGGLIAFLSTPLGKRFVATMYATIEPILQARKKYKHLGSTDIRPCLRNLIDLVKLGPA
jgi:hypothetical protein